MSKREQLPCAECGKAGGLGQEVEIETTGWRPCKVYSKPGGGVEVKKGDHESNSYDGEVSRECDIACANCGTTFATWEEATADKAFEYRCAKCGWWGLQDWLHVDCDGELAKIKHPSVVAS